MSAELPPPITTTEEVRFSRTLTEKITVHSWFCKCGRPLGKDSAKRSIQNHGKIICGECVQKEDADFQKWKREQAIIKFMQEV
jgi:hypothetical protein